MAIKNSVRLQCNDCKEINYLTFKNIKKHPEKLNLNKYCNRCQKSNVHQEIKSKK